MLSVADIWSGIKYIAQNVDWPSGNGEEPSNGTRPPRTQKLPYPVQDTVPDSPYVPDIFEDWAYGGAVAKNLPACGVANVMMQPEYEQRMKCAPGYVAVRCRGAGGEIIEACMLKGVARVMGLWKPRRKPPISASDYRALGKAERTVKKLTNIAKRAGALPKPKRRSR